MSERMSLIVIMVAGVLSFLFSGRVCSSDEPDFKAQKTPQDVTVLPGAFSHNDYFRERPLFSALDRGFLFVEADLYLRDGALRVAHHPDGIDPSRTLKTLYLDPLKERVQKLDGEVYPNNPHQFWLMLDLKSDGEEMWPHLHDVLKEYKEILAVIRDGEVQPGPVRVVISGDRPIEMMRSEDPLYAGVDGRLSDLDSDAPAWFMPWISDHWGTYFTWDGEGEMPEKERKKLSRIVQLVHEDDRMLRFWHTPEKPKLWRELLKQDVDMIATDKVDKLQSFLLEHRE